MPYRNFNILVVEDDEFQSKIIIEMLHSLQIHSTSVVNNGQEALAALHDASKKKFDLILSDLRMPKMDGMALLRHIGEEHQDLQVIILSGVDNKLLAAVSKVCSMYKVKLLDTLEKPLSLQKLKSALVKSGSFPQFTTNGIKKPMHSYTVEEIQNGLRANQFTPFLQPKVDLKTGQIIGAEALARWNHPKDGLITPNAFIPILEENKCIDDLTFKILKASTLACKTLIDQNHAINIAVNLSLVSLENIEMADKITQVVTSVGISPQNITLEITESAAMTEAPRALENLARLYMNGFTLSIDDYGTGYSNLQQLTRIAFGELKIDQSFIQGIEQNEAMLIVVASSIDMAHKLKIKSVAEGIESEGDWRLLRKMDCDVGQGYLIAKPMPTEQFFTFVEDYKMKPIDTAPKMVQEQNKTQFKANEEYSILVVDNDSFVRRIIIEILNSFGFNKAKAVADAKTAIDLFETEKFDIVMTDIFMPNITGLEFIKRIRTGKTLAASDIRIIVLSNLTQSDVLGSALALDVNGLIVKPITPDIIERKIRHALSEPTHIHPKIAYEAVNINFTAENPKKSTEAIDFSNTKNIKETYYVPIHALVKGMVIKKAIYYKNGELLLNAGEILTDDMVKRIFAESKKIESMDFLIEKTESVTT